MDSHDTLDLCGQHLEMQTLIKWLAFSNTLTVTIMLLSKHAIIDMLSQFQEVYTCTTVGKIVNLKLGFLNFTA
jgi:hypothetical protein